MPVAQPQPVLPEVLLGVTLVPQHFLTGIYRGGERP